MPDACFNGAVLHQHGRRVVSHWCQEFIRSASMGPCFISTEDAGDYEAYSRWLVASMGPCFISTEDDEALTNFFGQRVASMGPCFISTEDPLGRRPQAVVDRASMGPCFISTEDPMWVTNSASRPDPSMGPCFISTEDRGHHPPFLNLNTLLQWGRASSARKTPRTHQMDQSAVRRFNGAVLHQHGRPPASQVLSLRRVGEAFSRGRDKSCLVIGISDRCSS